MFRFVSYFYNTMQCNVVCLFVPQDVDLRELFTFDKLRQSGRVEVITTEEFLEREALSGNLGVSPSEDVKRLKHQARSEGDSGMAGLLVQPPAGLSCMCVCAFVCVCVCVRANLVVCGIQ